MTLAITSAAFAAPLLPTVTGWPGYSLSYRMDGAAISGPATSIEPTRKNAGAVQLLALREVLVAEARHHRNNRQSKAASLTEAELRELNHMILRAGIAQRDAAGRANRRG